MVSFFVAVFASIAVANAGVSATPVARATCSPNAFGAGVAASIESVGYPGLEWGDQHNPPTSGDVLTGQSFRGYAAPDFRIQQDLARPLPPSYFIRDVNNNDLTVTVQGSGLSFSAAFGSGTQEFHIACQSCGLNTTPGSDFGSSCTITPVGNSGQCVTIGPDASSPLSIDSCDGSGAQLFNIVF